MRAGLGFVPVMTLALVLGLDARGDDDDDHDEHEGRRSGLRSGVAPVTDPTWKSECGSCHFAYPPGLLPARSWDAVLGGLSSHFGEDATVDEPTLKTLRAYAAANAADAAAGTFRLSASLVAATAGTTPTRISTIPALREEHLEEIPASWVTGNPDVKSWAACARCHTAADQGSFSEREIRIPGHTFRD